MMNEDSDLRLVYRGDHESLDGVWGPEDRERSKVELNYECNSESGYWFFRFIQVLGEGGIYRDQPGSGPPDGFSLARPFGVHASELLAYNKPRG